MVMWFPKSRTHDTLLTVSQTATFDTYRDLKTETRRYVVGDRPAHYQVPAIYKQLDQSTLGWSDYDFWNAMDYELLVYPELGQRQ